MRSAASGPKLAKKTWNIWGNPLLATERLYFYLIYISINTAFWYPFEFLYEKNRHESSLFLKKNVKNKKYIILWKSLFALQKHTALKPIYIFFIFLNRHESGVFLTENVNYTIVVFFFLLFLIFVSKTHQSHAYLIFFVEKTCMRASYFWWKMSKIKNTI